jgi:3'(2'), 5'-bisphosphate nucleotidase
MATTDDAVANRLAEEAGALLLELRRSGPAGWLLGALGDARAQRLLAHRLAELRPGDAVLSEEAADDPGRLAAQRVWIVDPLDGTREYTEPGRDDWAVHVALWAGGELVAGAVALPAAGRLHSTDPAGTAPGRRPGPFRIAVSRTRPPALVHALVDELDAELVPMGSAGVKATAVLRGEVDAYVHAGGQFEWDSAAPVAVCTAAGLHTSRVEGSPLRYNQPDPRLPDLVVCRREDAGRLLDAISARLPEGVVA